MAYKVERDNSTGAFGCHFSHNGHRYYARVKHVPLSWYTECTIYPEDILDMTWSKWNVPVTEEGLLSCIEEFVRMKEERA